MIASPAGAYFSRGVAPVSVWWSTEYVRAAPGGTGAAKTGGNYAASLAAQAAGLPYDKHLAGGILGWKAAGLPTKSGG